MGGRPGPACTPRGNAASPPAWLTARAGPRQRPSSPPRLQAASSQQGSSPSYTLDDSGRPRDMHLTLTRAEMEKVCMPLVMRTLDVVGDVLLDAKVRPGEVDDILLVGGQSRMPLVREKLKEKLGRAPHAGVNTDEAVALGAALYSSAVDRVSSMVLIDVLPMTIGVAMPGGVFTRVIERNTPLPAQRSFAVSTTRDNEKDAAKAAEERRGVELKERSGRFWGFLKKVVGKGQAEAVGRLTPTSSHRWRPWRRCRARCPCRTRGTGPAWRP
ncbi:Hsp70 family protein [Cystobacter fuscus]|uniref:Hsp70 family protein n=1 Tax=Cystobacter fuscus TaxID=43 RepID=UPI0037C08DA8